jgi:hypothetical protein
VHRSLASIIATVVACGGAVSTYSPQDGGTLDPDGASGAVSGNTDGSGNDGSGSGSGAASGGSSGSSSSGVSADSGTGVPSGEDAAIADGTVQDATFELPPAPRGLAGFTFVVNGAVQTPLMCPSDNWEFPTPSGQGTLSGQYPPIPGINSVVIVNTGTLPMPYLAQSLWNPGSANAVPGRLTGISYQLAGVLEPGAQVDITSVYEGGIVAILGSAQPLSNPDAGRFVGDEGQMPWPPGVQGGGGATIMYVAEIEVVTGCMVANRVFP